MCDVCFPNHATAVRQPQHNFSVTWKLDCFRRSKNWPVLGAVRFDWACNNYAIRDWIDKIRAQRNHNWTRENQIRSHTVTKCFGSNSDQGISIISNMLRYRISMTKNFPYISQLCIILHAFHSELFIFWCTFMYIELMNFWINVENRKIVLSRFL